MCAIASPLDYRCTFCEDFSFLSHQHIYYPLPKPCKKIATKNTENYSYLLNESILLMRLI